MRRLLIVFIIALIALPSLSSADARQFVPILLDYYGELQIDARFQNDKNTVNGRSTQIKDMTLQEKVSIYTLGYVYHPNFITYRLNLAAGLREEKYSSTFSEVPMSTDPITEYEFRMYLLPTHPYNLELFTVRRTPLVRASLSGVTPVNTSYGAVLKYDKKPYAGSLAYTHQTTDTSPASSESDVFSAMGIWFIGPFTTSAGYQNTNTTTSLNETTSRDYSYFKNIFEVKNMKLTSDVELTNQAQKGSHLVPLDVRSFYWKERLEQKLPLNFGATLENRYYEDTTKSGNLPETMVSTRETRLELSHQLYTSLRSLYTLAYLVSEFPQGEIETTTNTLNFAYIKRIPVGVMRAGADYRLIQTKRKGQPIIMNEFHTATAGTFTITDTFSLNNQGANESSIVVMVSTVVPPGDLPTFVELKRGLNYTVTPSGNSFLITILSVPAGVCQTTDCLFAPAFVYSFRVAYSSVLEDSRIDTTSYGANVRFELFKNLLSPYFSYYRTTQKLISGTLNGIPEDSTDLIVGLQVQKQPFMFLAEYENFTSNVNPFRAVRSEVNYNKDLSPSANLFAKLSYSSTDYPMGVSGTTAGYTETKYGAEVRIKKSFYSPKLAIALGLSYNQSNALATTKTYALNTGLSLRTGRTEIIFAGRASRSNIEGISTRQELTSSFFFLTFKRQFF